jgi:hypothetical protein
MTQIRARLTSRYSVPTDLRLVHVVLEVEGIRHEETLEADRDLEFVFSWNKRDVYGQKARKGSKACLKLILLLF